MKNILFCILLSFVSSTFAANEQIDIPAQNQDQDIDAGAADKKDKKSNKTKVVTLILGGTAAVILSALVYANKDKLMSHENRILGFYSDLTKVGMEGDMCSWCDVLLILKAEAHDYNGATAENTFFEKKHSFIQWLFPTYRPSDYNGDSDPLTKDIANEFKSKPELIEKLVESFLVVVGSYYKLQIEVTQAKSRDLDIVNISIGDKNNLQIIRKTWEPEYFGHNFKRISRILSSLFELGLDNYAIAFFNCLTDISNNNKLNNIPELAASYHEHWRKAVTNNNYKIDASGKVIPKI
jgi:hypothetical protein